MSLRDGTGCLSGTYHNRSLRTPGVWCLDDIYLETKRILTIQRDFNTSSAIHPHTCGLALGAWDNDDLERRDRRTV